MTVLRSREIVRRIKSSTPSKTVNNGVIEPMTPAKTLEPSTKPSCNTTPSSSSLLRIPEPLGLGSVSALESGITRRRSLRLALKTSSGEISGNVHTLRGKRKSAGSKTVVNSSSELSPENVRGLDESKSSSDLGGLGQTALRLSRGKGKRKLDVEVDLLSLESVGEGKRERGFLNLRSRKKITEIRLVGTGGGGCDDNGVDRSGDVESGNNDILILENKSGARCIIREGNSPLDGGSGKSVLMNDSDLDQVAVNENGTRKSRRRFSRGAKGKAKLVDEVLVTDGVDPLKLNSGSSTATLVFNTVADVRCLSGRVDENITDSRAKKRFTREEKGKGKVVESDLLSGGIDAAERELKIDLEKSLERALSSTVDLVDSEVVQDGKQVIGSGVSMTDTRRDYKERFKNIARKNASRFAHFSSQYEEENYVADEVERETPQGEVERGMEDWPGPFSTAIKIINDRQMNANMKQKNCSLNKNQPSLVSWAPKKDRHHDCSKNFVPSLQDLSMKILAKNAGAITSLDCVPDVIRHKLTQLLCDSRRMTGHFLNLLVRGSPTEICVKDCSWLTEEEFTRTFEGCNTNNLMVLQLDQCGRCMPDYILFSALARRSNGLPALTTISLKGACRLSDAGLSALVSSAPTLRSINLSQCSLLTSDGINSLAESMGSVLRELFIDDCQNIDAILILPALLKLEHLEVLSLAGMQTVCDDFISKFIAARGHNIKELVLTDCVSLTDASLKVIAGNCSRLCAIDLANLHKLTDFAIGYLCNGCPAIQTLKLCRNTFSDEAIAAYLETCGESLKELSLNNVNKVAHNTAISLARHSRNLLSLDLSWCRYLTNEALGLIVDSCLSLKLLKLFGCTQVTNVFLDGHSNLEVKIIGLKMTPILEQVKNPQQYSVRG